MGAVSLTVRELADLLDPPVTVEQVSHLIQYLKLEPCGWRRSGRRGRPAALYEARVIMEAHALLIPLMMREHSQDADAAGSASGTASSCPPRPPHRQYGHHG